ncbi:Sec-independent protein translocase subunit TatA/TatB [Planctomicrobium sp. SH664]|uniref:Sec-independent protein translocase subunit TatA/TatB n=1 Tax=Planctomicrobium sp. SH664 TaxID=3448125 RepID=UPI003F5B7ACB
MFGFGMGELLVFAIVVLVLFGHRLPSAMKGLGTSIRAFQAGAREEESPLLPK